MILVTGMHRSGTSLVAMTMEALGVHFGDHADFYAADDWNPRGYFERRDVMDINSHMITGLERTGSRLAALVGQAIYLSQPRVEKVVARGRSHTRGMQAIETELGSEAAIKDPRFCITWSAWADVVGIDLCVVCIRHPWEVADSLRRRQSIPVRLGLRFWRYHIQALRETTPERLVVVDLDSLVERPQAELEMLGKAAGLQVDGDEAAARFDLAYSPALKKNISPTERPRLDRQTEDLWDWLTGERPIPVVGRPE